jgi:hypothetical protein
MRRVVFVTVLALALVDGAAGCCRPAADIAAPSASSAAATAPPSERAAIYSAMLLYFLNHGAGGVGAGPLPPAYVLDVAQGDAGVPTSGRQPATDPITPEDQAAILAALRDPGTGYAGRARFVSSGADLMVSDSGCVRMKDGGVLITLAPVQGAPGAGTDRLEVGITGFFACLGASGVDYVVVRSSTGWTVTGNTGTMWMA